VVVGSGGTFPLAAGEAARKGAIVPGRSRVLAFRIGGTAALPAVTPAPPPAKPPARFASAKILPVGKILYEGYCSVCHGDSAVGGGVLPDLRWVGELGSPEAWRSVVLEGSHAKNGMVSFASTLSPDLAELVRAYVVDRANDTYPEP